LSNAQKEVRSWPTKVNCSMGEGPVFDDWAVSRRGKESVNAVPFCYLPKNTPAPSCSKPTCATCERAKARVKKPKSVKQNEMKEQENMLSKGIYKA